MVKAPSFNMTEAEIIIQKFPVVLFDDTCLFCSRAVQFILKNEKGVPFYFVPLQSPALKNLPGLNGLSENSDSLILLYRGNVYLCSDAVLQTARLIGFPWNLTGIFFLIPRAMRNGLYRWIASHRYQWFGKTNTCMAFTGKFRGRLLEIT